MTELDVWIWGGVTLLFVVGAIVAFIGAVMAGDGRYGPIAAWEVAIVIAGYAMAIGSLVVAGWIFVGLANYA